MEIEGDHNSVISDRDFDGWGIVIFEHGQRGEEKIFHIQTRVVYGEVDGLALDSIHHSHRKRFVFLGKDIHDFLR
jgi:hypothetical protein